MKINLVDDIDHVEKSGDAWPYYDKEKDCMRLVLACPRCGGISASAGSHKWDAQTQTYTPSIVHSVALGGCGWHGYIRNGEFVDA